MAGVTQWLELNGFKRAGTVREPGDYAIRGGIVDLFAPGMDAPVRLDFFGDTLELVRSFDPETQRTTDELRALDLVPMAEFQLTTDTIRAFRTGYIAAFGAAAPDDVLYEAVSEGRRAAGIEHWPPLFHARLDTVFDYLERSRSRSSRWRKRPRTSASARSPTITRHAKKRSISRARTYKPLPPDRLYLAEAEWREQLDRLALARITAFAAPEGPGGIDVAARPGHNFVAERSEAANVFDAVTKHVAALQASGKRVVIAMWTDGSRERMAHVLAEHHLANLTPVSSWPQAQALPRPQVALAVLGIELGFETDDVALITEEDISANALFARAAPRGAPTISSPKLPASLRATSSFTSITASAALSACARSRRRVRRTTAWKSITPAATSCSCRSRTSNCCRVTARKNPASNWTGWAPVPGRRARRG